MTPGIAAESPLLLDGKGLSARFQLAGTELMAVRSVDLGVADVAPAID